MTKRRAFLCTTLLIFCCVTPAGVAHSQGTKPQPGKTQAAPPDPAFAGYAYPGATPRGTEQTTQMTSKTYTTRDSFDAVIKFYIKKFTRPGVVQGNSAHFGKTNPDGSGFTVTITRRYDKPTLILLRLEKKPS